jgi:hypothetical protein
VFYFSSREDKKKKNGILTFFPQHPEHPGIDKYTFIPDGLTVVGLSRKA